MSDLGHLQVHIGDGSESDPSPNIVLKILRKRQITLQNPSPFHPSPELAIGDGSEVGSISKPYPALDLKFIDFHISPTSLTQQRNWRWIRPRIRLQFHPSLPLELEMDPR